MKKFLSFLIISLLAVASVIGLFACDSKKETDTEPGLKMHLIDNEYYSVYDYVCDGETTELKIPAQKKGYPVREIESNAFSGNDVLTEIIVPASVKTIHEGAFAGVKKLAKLTVPFIGKTAKSDAYYLETTDSDKSVGVERTFAYFFGTESFNYGVQLTTKYNGGESDTKTYYVPVSLKEVVVDAPSEYSIPMYAFSGNTVLNKVVLNGEIDKIGDYAFNGCEMLSEVVVPDTVTYIGKYAFNNTKSLTNAGFSFEDSDLALTIGDYAFYGIGVKDMVIPARTTSFGEFAFSASAIENVTISTEKIANYAFKDCVNLKSVVIGDATKNVGVYAFDGCKTLVSFGKTVSVTPSIDLSTIDVLGAMSFARLNTNAKYSVVSNAKIDSVLDYAFFQTERA